MLSLLSPLFSWLLLPILAVRADTEMGIRKNFKLTVTWDDHAPDGFTRKMLLVNGNSPGPVIEVDQGDWVVVRVCNQSPFPTTVHYHGIDMAATPWSDGVPGITQRPIPPGGSFTYEFSASQYGSYWYHSHSGGQIEDGLYGPIIIHPKKTIPNPFHKITPKLDVQRELAAAERQVVPLVLADFTHIPSERKWNLTQEAGFEASCYDSILFNGKGKVKCMPASVIAAHLSDIQIAALRLEGEEAMTDKGCLPPLVPPGSSPTNQTALYAEAFTGCKNTTGSTEVIHIIVPQTSRDQWLAFDVIGGLNFVTATFSVDSHDMWVYATDGSYIEPQKVQAIPIGNGERYSVFVRVQQSGIFTIRCNSITTAQLLIGQAVLSVEGKRLPDGESVPYIDIGGNPTSSNVTFFDQTKASPYPPERIPQNADVFYPLNMTVDGASYLWAMNNSRLMPGSVAQKTPTLFYPSLGVQNNVTISTRYGDWVDLLFGTGNVPMPPHSIHKHGIKMYIIGSGYGPFHWNSTQSAMKDIPERFNLVNPPKRDTFQTTLAVNNASWTIVRYHAAFPGPWLLHCHLDNHLEGGMMMIIQDAIDNWPRVPMSYLSYGT